MKHIKKFILTLPPLAEQQRIVAKVEQLLGLCDQLEQQLAQSQDLGSRSLAALIQHALV
ncbi:type I restriction-modification system, S subunit [Herpetosiphon aurantiacus DSM 785]|uniref:Type I restriction-modification system, S subunit n=1 Tax=Herpetosiphon aurantiacus (strain ATCC 23779 / DSM 785 / 114-95) TaxID=316274 RepID=A9B1P3_HERA2|nr:type I restriction-modification system, S subunit [Herpetosiphon aurantiacus DSM 785]